MLLQIKHGADCSKLCPEIWAAAMQANTIMSGHQVPGVITCARQWREKGLHPHGYAVDMRANHVQPTLRKLIDDKLHNHFKGTKIQVLLHGEGDNIHWHIEHDDGVTKKLPIPAKKDYR